MPGLKKVTPEDRLLVGVKRLRRELDMIIREYETEKAPLRPSKRKIKFKNPYTGKTEFF